MTFRGDGRDKLKLTADGTLNADMKSIYSNFEVLDIGKIAAASQFNIALLGVDSVVVSESSADSDTDDAVLQPFMLTLNGMADGMSFRVKGATASVTHDMTDRKAGDPRYSGELEVSLTAMGGKDDKKDAATGEAVLTLVTDTEIENLDIDSSANPGGKAAAGDYENTLTLNLAQNTSATVEVVRVTGNAQLKLKGGGAALNQLEVLDAKGNSGGVTFEATGSGAVDLMGGSGMDKLTGGSAIDEIMGGAGKDTLSGADGNDEITGGAGADTLTGGEGADEFIYSTVSDSQLAAYDSITDFSSGTDKIVLPKAVLSALKGVIKAADTVNVAGASWKIDNTDESDDPDNTPDSLQAFITANADGFFETKTSTTGDGFGGDVTQHSVAMVAADLYTTRSTDNGPLDGGEQNTTFLFIDVDGNGDFDAATDMVIQLTSGNSVSVEETDFSAG